ncbi:MAG: murein transglycosylase domain-containing protein [Rikenellaceae bacterium]
MKKAIIIPVLLMFSPLAAQQSSIEQLRAEQQQRMNSMKTEYSDRVDQMHKEYEQWVELMREEHQAFQKKIAHKWGDEQAVETTAKTWVEYSDDESTRSIVDFESGEVKVEVLLSDSDFDSEGNVLPGRMEQAVEMALSSRGHTMDYQSEYEPRKEVSKTAILEDMVDLSTIAPSSAAKTTPNAPSSPQSYTATSSSRSYSSGVTTSAAVLGEAPPVSTGETPKPKSESTTTTVVETIPTPAPAAVEKKEVKSVATKIVETVKPTVTTQKNSEGETKKVATIELKLVDNHLSKMAATYRPLVSKYSAEYGIDEPIIYAIMEQESAFNPTAKSWVPAYGLMQLVPTSGGRDAYNYVHKKDKIVSGDYLFEPANNIELGAAYFKILKTRNFHKVTDPECQLLCMVAAYNCGAGNVSRAITGNTNLTKAIPEINKMNYDQLYSHFRKNLPDETKDYIYKITRNIKKYSSK